jgi:hypothetical protein
VQKSGHFSGDANGFCFCVCLVGPHAVRRGTIGDGRRDVKVGRVVADRGPLGAWVAL